MGEWIGVGTVLTAHKLVVTVINATCAEGAAVGGGSVADTACGLVGALSAGGVTADGRLGSDGISYSMYVEYS